LVFIEKSKSKRFVDITGVKFGRLTPLGISGHRKNYPSQYCWFCKCDCGNIISVGRGDLVSKNTSSCGCLASESKKSVNTIHGHDRKGIVEKTYKIWTSMRQRCRNPNDTSYHGYGGRGINVCDRWDSYANFINDMGPRPVGTSIDRINNDGDYEPSNCRWATKSEQSNNKRTSRFIEIDGIKMTMSEWELKMGLNVGMVSRRIKSGWPPEMAVLTPIKRLNRYCYAKRNGSVG